MINLEPAGPFQDGTLPIKASGCELRVEIMPGILSIMPKISQSGGIKASLGVKLPDIGKASSGRGGQVFWVGMGQWFWVSDTVELHGELSKSLSDYAVITDISDAWVGLCLSGPEINDIMARLCPLDLVNLAIGEVAHSEIAHIPVILRPQDNGLHLLVMRSLAQSLIEPVKTAMKSVAAQSLL